MPRAIATVNGSPNGLVDAPINTLVQLGNDGLGDESTYLWSITDQPPGTADTLSNVAAASPTFTPRKEGSYLLLLIVDSGLGTERRDTNVVGVRQFKTRTRIPAAGEQSEAGALRGHAQDANQLLQLLDAMRADPLLTVAQANGALTRNTVVRFTGMATLKSGLPGEEQIPIVSAAPASAANVLTEQLGVVEGNVDLSGNSVSTGQLVLVRMGGVQKAGGITGSAGASVYVSNAGVLTLTPGTNQRYMGTLITASDVLLGFGNSAGNVALSSAIPAAVGAAGVAGTALTATRADHVHAHGDQLGGTLHAIVTTSIPGFMSAEDKVKLDGVSAGATPVGLGNSVPMTIAAVGAPGDSTLASRENHVHAHGNQEGGTTHALVTVSVAGFMSAPDKVKLDGISTGATNTPLSSATPSPIAAVGGVGSASNAARGDHVHAHADQGGGTQHTVASPALAGFMSAADKAKLDGINPDISGALGLSAVIPAAVAAASAIGVDTSAARGDHVHAHGNQAGGALHAIVTIAVPGFMSAADKIKLDGIATNATALGLATTAPTALGVAAAVGTGTTAARADHVHPHNLASTNPVAVGVTAIGTALTAARADHVHAHGNQAGGTLHSIATTAVPGFLSAADKTLIDTGFARLVGGNLFSGNQGVLGSVSSTGDILSQSAIAAGGWTPTFAGDIVGDVVRVGSYAFNSPVTVPRYANMARDVTTFSGPDTPPAWTYAQNDSTVRWLCLGVGNSPIYIALNPPHGSTLQLVVLNIQPITARATLGNRMRARLYITNPSGNLTYLDAGLNYDNGSASAQQITWSLSRTVNLTTETYTIVLYAGNSSGDSLFGAASSGVTSVLPPF